MIRGTDEIRAAYRDEQVAARYVTQRFVEPLGALLHARQVAHLTRLCRIAKPQRVLEIAPGPARLTKDVRPSLANPPVLVDASAQMLAEARRRLPTASSCRFVQADAFALPLRGPFDLIYTFRFIRHFEDADRQRLYAGMKALLAPGGVLVFDAVNRQVSEPLRLAKPDEYQHYDALLTRETLAAELAQAGLRIVSLTGVQRRYGVQSRLQVLVAPRSRQLARGAMEIVDRWSGGEPLEWIVTCQRA